MRSIIKIVVGFVLLFVLVCICVQFLYTETGEFSNHLSDLVPVDGEYIETLRIQTMCTQKTSNRSSSQGAIQSYVPFTEGKIKIALGGAITTKGYTDLKANESESMILFTVLLQSFCETASVGFEYHFYFGYDEDDILSSPEYQLGINTTFWSYMATNCPANITIGGFHMLRCSYSGKPPWAQNDAMMQAYFDGMDFLYRLNDDSKLRSTGWTEIFISTLSTFEPPYIGLVGPIHDFGPADIMTHEFVHRSHIDIFGFYYPRHFQDWYGDTFMNYLYAPDRCVQLLDVLLVHTESLGMRYKVKASGLRKETIILAEGHKKIMKSYIKLVSETRESVPVINNHDKIVSMSLFGDITDYTYGAIRNAQLVQLLLPEWTLRIYHHPKPNGTLSGETHHEHLYVSDYVLATLQIYHVQLKEVKDDILLEAPEMWRYLVLDDEAVDYALIRDSDSRLTLREVRLVETWLRITKNSRSALYCIRDHPFHGRVPLTDGLWGARVKPLLHFLGRSISDLIKNSIFKKNQTDLVLTNQPFSINPILSLIWMKSGESIFCHDSVSCNVWPHANSAPRKASDGDGYIGQKYGAHGEKLAEGVAVNTLDKYNPFNPKLHAGVKGIDLNPLCAWTNITHLNDII